MNKGVSFLETGIHNTSEIGRLKRSFSTALAVSWKI